MHKKQGCLLSCFSFNNYMGVTELSFIATGPGKSLFKEMLCFCGLPFLSGFDITSHHSTLNCSVTSCDAEFIFQQRI